MVANMIGVRKRVIVFGNEGTYMTMFNPEIIKKSWSYDAEEVVFLCWAPHENANAIIPSKSNGKLPNSKLVSDLHRLDSSNHPARSRLLQLNFNLSLIHIFWYKRLISIIFETLEKDNDRVPGIYSISVSYTHLCRSPHGVLCRDPWLYRDLSKAEEGIPPRKAVLHGW